jgi:hypothetical protein
VEPKTGLSKRIRYRVWQVWRALLAGPLSAAEREEIERVLSPSEQAVFYGQPNGGQQHGYRVMQTLLQAGHDDHHLLAAALLHDVGKYRLAYRIWDRALVVVAQRLAPSRVGEWGRHRATGWRRPFVVKLQHGCWGAESARRAGSSELTVRLIELHQETVLPATAADISGQWCLLRWADDRN